MIICRIGSLGTQIYNSLILLAKRLDDHWGLSRKALRIIQYRNSGRIEALREETGMRRYAHGFEELIKLINLMQPANEVIGDALRKQVLTFPEAAIRELVANALIDQDLAITGAGTLVEIFENRIEITNPGEPLVDAQRFVDSPPRSRNEALASFMRRIGIYEERGSGWDKIALQCEIHQMPAPRIEVVGG